LLQQRGILGFGGTMPINIQLPPKMANLILMMVNLATQFNKKQHENMSLGDEVMKMVLNKTLVMMLSESI
jgi:hypothetical protein